MSNSRPNISSDASNSEPQDSRMFGGTSSHNARKKVYVGMSGGVDSSVSALLLKQQGYDVTGVFIKVWQPDSADCGWKDERRDAMRVAALLDIPFKTFDFSEQYKREVVDYMIAEYKAGRTPNPDIMCNRHVKFGSFLQQALADGVDFVATGHYAQIDISHTGQYELCEGADSNKDQSYFLWTLTQQDLEHVLFPIGHLQKPEVRAIAEKAGLPVFDKKDSQGVCFIGHLDMKEFLKSHIQTEKGRVLNQAGETIGEHDGAALYTIGERHGFTLHNSQVASEPHFIISKNIAENTITVASRSAMNDSSLPGQAVGVLAVRLEKPNISAYAMKAAADTSGAKGQTGLACSARIRYRQEKQRCRLSLSDNGEWTVTFDEPQKGAAEGQSVVLYGLEGLGHGSGPARAMDNQGGSACLGGGILTFI